AEALIDHELERFTRWLETLEVVPTITALQERGNTIARQVLAENQSGWEDLSEADRERLELVAATIAKRLLQQPILRLKARSDEHATYAYIQALRELFGLDTERASAFTETAGDTRAEHGTGVTPIRRRRAK